MFVASLFIVKVPAKMIILEVFAFEHSYKTKLRYSFFFSVLNALERIDIYIPSTHLYF